MDKFKKLKRIIKKEIVCPHRRGCSCRTLRGLGELHINTRKTTKKIEQYYDREEFGIPGFRKAIFYFNRGEGNRNGKYTYCDVIDNFVKKDPVLRMLYRSLKREALKEERRKKL